MAVLDPVEVCRLAKSVGFRYGSGQDIMVAIARAESGFDSTIESRPNTDGSTDLGLWQINSHHLPGNKYGTLVGFTKEMLLAPDGKDNARAARIIYDRQGFGAWVVYDTGAYKTHIMLAQTARRLDSALTEIDKLLIQLTNKNLELEASNAVRLALEVKLKRLDDIIHE